MFYMKSVFVVGEGSGGTRFTTRVFSFKTFTCTIRVVGGVCYIECTPQTRLKMSQFSLVRAHSSSRTHHTTTAELKSITRPVKADRHAQDQHVIPELGV
jgi:hypothetical protein